MRRSLLLLLARVLLLAIGGFDDAVQLAASTGGSRDQIGDFALARYQREAARAEVDDCQRASPPDWTCCSVSDDRRSSDPEPI